MYKNSVLEASRRRWIDENSIMDASRRRWIDENTGLEVLARGGTPSGPMRNCRTGTPRKLHFLMILTISGIRITGNRKMWTGD